MAPERVMMGKLIAVLVTAITVIGLVALWRGGGGNNSQPHVPTKHPPLRRAPVDFTGLTGPTAKVIWRV